MFAVLKFINILAAKKMKFIGEDIYKNKYYQKKDGTRICIYYKTTEPSKIPPEWFAFMHYFPESKNEIVQKKRNFWQKYHTPNESGSEFVKFSQNSVKSSVKTGILEDEKVYKSWNV